jgi:alcohol dehydrogenase
MPADALVLEAPRSLVRRRFGVPDVGEDDAVLRVEACGLCGTHHELYTGALTPGFPFVPGHETVGTIESIGPAAAERWAVDVGDRVAVECFQSCRRCARCRSEDYRHCELHGLKDMYGMVSATRAPSLWGGFATHQYLAPDSMLLPIPDELDPVLAVAFNPVGAGVRWGVTVPGTGPGDVVAVLGCGMRGLAAAAAAKHAGADFVLVTGAGPRDRERLALAPSFGADLAIDVLTHDPAAELRRRTGGGADVVVDVTSNAPQAFGQAITIAAASARVVVAGTRGSGSGAPGFEPDAIVYKELAVHGALGVDAAAYGAAIDLLVAGTFPFADLPRAVVGLDGVSDLLMTMAGERDVPPVHAVLVPHTETL